MLSGRGSTVLVSGEAGIGKTTLVDWLSGEAETQGCLVLRGGCYDLSTTPPYGPWLEILRAYPHDNDTLPPLPRFVGDLEAAAALGSQRQLFSTARDFFRAICSYQPLVMVLEDLHWADQASLDFLRVLARQIANQRTLLVITYRSDELQHPQPLSTFLPALIREAQVTRLEVRPLNDAEQQSLIESRYTLAVPDQSRLAHYLSTHSEGNPLYVSELLRTLEDAAVLVEDDSTWRVGDLEHVRIPPLLRQVIEGRLAHLSEMPRFLLQVAAIIGQDVPVSLWQQVSEASDEDLIQAIEEGQAVQLIKEVGAGTSYRFRHGLFREALYAEVVALRRNQWHLKVAEILSTMSAPDLDMVAQHFLRAGDDRAVDWLLRAGERAAVLYASRNAIDRFEAVLPLLESERDDRRRGWVFFLLGEQFSIKDAARAVDCYDEAERLGLSIGDSLLMAQARLYRGLRRGIQQSHLREGLADITSGVDLLDQLERENLRQPPVHARVWRHPDEYHAFRSACLAMVGALSAALEDVPNYTLDVSGGQIELSLDSRSFLAMASAYNALGRVWAMKGRPAESGRAFERSADLVTQKNDDTWVASICMNWLAYLVLPYFADDRDLRYEVLRRHDSGWERSIEQLAVGPMPDGVSHLLTSYLDGAWSEMDWMTSWWNERMVGSPEPWAIVKEVVFARRAHARGDLGGARRDIRRILPDGPATEPGDSIFRGAEELQRLAVELELGAGNLPEAHDWLKAHDRWLEWSGAFTGRAEGQLLWAQYHFANGDRRPARQLAEAALKLASEPRQPLALIAIHRFLGQLEAKDECVDPSEHHLMQSLTLADACDAPFERALTLLELADLRVTQDQPDEAAFLLGEVQTICEPLEAGPTLDRVDAIREQLSRLTERVPQLSRRIEQAGG